MSYGGGEEEEESNSFASCTEHFGVVKFTLTASVGCDLENCCHS